MSAPVDVLAMRDPQDDPRVGDLLQVIPPFGGELPKPMTVLSVDEREVTWTRDGWGQVSTSLKVWRSRTNTGGGERRIVYADAATSRVGGAA